jgi:hypothetical protein
MKKLITLTLSLFFTLSIYGQNVLTITYETWISSTWENSMKQNNSYDGSGFLTNNLSQIWDNPTNSWKNNSQINYSNNVNGTVQQYIAQSWDKPLNSWKNSQRATYTYNNSTGIYETNEIAFHFYPNPINDFLNLYLENNSESNIKITDLHGRTLLSKMIIGKSTIIDIKGIPSGVYFLRLQQGNNVSVSKFIKN